MIEADCAAFQTGDRTALRDTLLECDVIIYDLVQSLDEASWAINGTCRVRNSSTSFREAALLILRHRAVLAELSDQFANKPKTFVGVSTIMTWARTKGDPVKGPGTSVQYELSPN